MDIKVLQALMGQGGGAQSAGMFPSGFSGVPGAFGGGGGGGWRHPMRVNENAPLSPDIGAPDVGGAPLSSYPGTSSALPGQDDSRFGPPFVDPWGSAEAWASRSAPDLLNSSKVAGPNQAGATMAMQQGYQAALKALKAQHDWELQQAKRASLFGPKVRAEESPGPKMHAGPYDDPAGPARWAAEHQDQLIKPPMPTGAVGG